MQLRLSKQRKHAAQIRICAYDQQVGRATQITYMFRVLWEDRLPDTSPETAPGNDGCERAPLHMNEHQVGVTQ